MFKTLATSVVMFLALFCSAFGQSHVPTLQSNNAWLGTNSFLAGHLILNGGNSCAQQNLAGQVMVGYAADFTPICMSVGQGVNSLNTLTGNLAITNTDNNLNITLQGQSTIQINCPGCGGGGGTTPGGGQGALQWNNSGSLAGTVVTGMVKSSSAGPVAAIPETDFALPFTITCNTGLTCPKVGTSYTFTLTGSAGTGDVATANFGQMGGYSSAGTTIGGSPNIYSLNPGWSQTQIQALFSRFSGTQVTGYSITSNVMTILGINSFTAGEDAEFFNFPVSSNFLNGANATVLSSGLSDTQFEVNLTHSDVTSSDTGIAFPPSGNSGIVIIPPGLPEQPSTSFFNGSAQVLDWRKGFAWQQISQYGVKCDARTLFVTVTAGSNLVSVGSSFASDQQPVGMTMAIGSQTGYGQFGVQQDWEPVVTGFTYPNVILSSNAPFNYSGTAIFGTNNQTALTQAFNNVNGIFPLNIPTGCTMLTDTVRWNGANLIGQQMNYSGMYGFPGHDILQQQDGTAISAWSIDATAGTTTFTIPSYASHNILLGDVVNLRSFVTSTFFNNQNVSIASQPTPTTFTVNNAFGQSTRSSTEVGLAAPTTNVNQNGLRMENLTFNVNNSIDPTFSWNHYDSQTAALTVEPPMYRPLQEFGQPMNNPFGAGWGVGQINGVATIAQNSAVICLPNTGRIPAVNSKFILPYQGTGEFVGTVASTAGSCGSGQTPRTLSAALPNNSAYTSSQAEWFSFGAVQTITAAIPSTISYPYTITLNLPVAPVPGFESNVSSHGRVIINGDQFDYMGITYGVTNGTSQLVLRDGPTSINGGAGSAIGSAVFPLNPCSAMYNNPWPVVPTLNSGAATPLYATYYAGICGGNAAMSFPSSDANAWTPNASGLSIAYFNNVSGVYVTQNSLGNTDNNGSMLIYEQGNNTGYGNTFDNLRVAGLWGGFMQGPASVNQNGVRNVGPTSTGQSLRNCTFRAAYSITLYSWQQGNIDRCDTYSTETSPYDGTNVGSSTGLYIGYSLSEQDGAAITGTAQLTIKDYNNEPENGNHEELPVSVESDCNNCNFIQTIFEGGYNIFGGSYQILHGTFMGNPTFNYGKNNYFEHLYGLNTGYNSPNVYDPSHFQFYNWGTNSTCQSANGPQTTCGPGFVQSYDGHDMASALFGNLIHPSENVLGGMIVPGEWDNNSGLGNSMTTPLVFDNTELWWGSHSECALGTSGQNCRVGEFDGFNGFIYIGPHQRISNAPYVLKANLKVPSGTMTFNLLIQALESGSGTCSTVNSSLSSTTVTVTNSWNPVLIPIDFSSNAGCALEVVFQNATSNNMLQVGYFNFVPFPGSGTLTMPLGTHTVGDSCPVAGVFELDHSHMWTCSPLSGTAFGAGTWQQH